VGLSPTIYGGLADLNGDEAVDGDDDSNAFYGDTSIIDGGLDCDAWTANNDGTAGDGTIDDNDDCTLIGYDGTTDGVTIEVVDGAFETADGDPIADGTPLPTVFNAGDPDNADIGDSDFAWSTSFGRVDSNGDEVIDGDDCHFGIIGGANILGSDPGCGFAVTPPAAVNGHVDLNGDGKSTAADWCSDGCFFGHDVFNGLVQAGPVPFGEPLYDKATLLGTANEPGDNGGDGQGNYLSINATNGAPADGTLTFTLKGPSSTVCGVTATPAEGNNPEDVDVTGDGNYITTGFTPDSPGDFHWQASYEGSTFGNTLGTSHNDACDEDGEDVTVQQLQPNMDTAQEFVPNDSATITVSTNAAGALAGDVVFQLFVGTAAADCSGDPAYESDPIDITTGSGTGTSSTVMSDNETAYDEDESFAWVVVYTSTNPAHLGVTSSCGNETSSITIDNGVTQPAST
jgi:hypothetical protein